MSEELCKLENVTADGVVCGSVIAIEGEIYATNWREIQVDKYFCDCGDYFDESDLVEHLGGIKTIERSQNE